MSVGKGTFWKPLYVMGALILVAVAVFQYCSNLQGDPIATGAGFGPSRSFLERKKRQLLKIWRQIQLFLGEDPEPLSGRNAHGALNPVIESIQAHAALQAKVGLNPRSAGPSPDLQKGARPFDPESFPPLLSSDRAAAHRLLETGCFVTPRRRPHLEEGIRVIRSPTTSDWTSTCRWDPVSKR